MSGISQALRRDAQKSPEELEHEIDVTRAELEDTLEELEHRFSPNELLNQVLSRVRQHGGEFTQNLGDTVKQHPLPTLLTSIGIAWLMASNGRDADGDGAPGLRRGMQEARDAIHRGRDKMGAARERASSMLQRGRNSMREGARVGAKQLLADQPLLLGVLGLAAGALLGAALPASEQEDRSLGRLRDQALEKAKAAGAQGMRRAREKAEQLASERRETLIGDDVGEASDAERQSAASDAGPQPEQPAADSYEPARADRGVQPASSAPPSDS